MRKYHLSALNLFQGLSLLSSQCSGRLCDNTNAVTQTGNNSSPIGGPSDLGLPLSLTHTHTHTQTLSHALSFSVSRQARIRGNPCPPHPRKKNTQKDTLRHTHFIHTSVCHLRLWKSGLPLYCLFTDTRPMEKQPLGMPSKLNTHQQQTQKVFTKPPSLSVTALTGFLGGLQEVGKIKDKHQQRNENITFPQHKFFQFFYIYIVID